MPTKQKSKLRVRIPLVTPPTPSNRISEVRDITKETGAADKVMFSSGALRSHKPMRFDLVPAQFTRRVANRYTVGSVKYGDYNWLKGLGDREYVLGFMNHIESHWLDFKRDGTFRDDNLGAIGWGIAALMEVERINHRVLNQIIFSPKVITGEFSIQQFEEIYMPNKSPFVIEV